MKIPAFQVQPLQIGPFELTSLNRQMGVGVPSTRGLFPVQPSQFTKNPWSAWGPAENLAPPPDLAAERAMQRHATWQRSLLNRLALLDPASEVDESFLTELGGAGIGTGGFKKVSDVLKFLRGKVGREEIDALSDEEEATLKTSRPDVWSYWLGAPEE